MRFPTARNWLLVHLVFAANPALLVAQAQPDGSDHGIGLADLPAELAALSGKSEVSGQPNSQPPPVVAFRELWDHRNKWQGSRVQVEGTIARIFRQDAVGSFPPLAEAWLSEPEGNLLCILFPQSNAHTGSLHTQSEYAIPETGRVIKFTGTFLKTIRYAAGDEPRLAPLIVGDRPPVPTSSPPNAERNDVATALRSIGTSPETSPGWAKTNGSWSFGGWLLGLALGLVTAVILAWRHVRKPSGLRSFAKMNGRRSFTSADPPLEFFDTEPQHQATESNLESADPSAKRN
jgi:hypothetical protein